MLSPLRAGVGRVWLSPRLGTPMMGYGARRGTANARHDPLGVRALYLGSSAGEALLVECDLCLIGVSQAAEVRARIADATGIAPGGILVGCIHTHSGPDTGLASTLFGGSAPEGVAEIFDAVVRAATAAHDSAEEARIGAGTADAHIGRNRRSADGPLDSTVVVLRVDRADGRPLAVLYSYGCHPTALGHDNLAFSADWPGAAAREIEAALPGALAIFALGAHADVDPRTRGLLDLAIPGQSVGVGFDEMEALGREVGRAVAAEAIDLGTREDAEIAAAAERVRVPVHGGGLAQGAYEAHLAAARARALEALDEPRDAALRTNDFYRLEAERTAGLPPDEVRERLARVRIYLRDRSAPRVAGARVPEVEVQVIRMGPVRLLGLPLEVCVDVGHEWRRRAPGGLGAIVSIANGWLRYLPHAENFREPLAHQKYEILQSTLAPEAATQLLDAAERLAARLG